MALIIPILADSCLHLFLLHRCQMLLNNFKLLMMMCLKQKKRKRIL